MARWPGSLVGLALLASSGAAFPADSAIIARVGSEPISAALLEQQLALLPDFQRQALADSPAHLKRQVLDAMLVPETLYAAEARRQGLEQEPLVRDRVRGVLGDALQRALREELVHTNPVTSKDVKEYYAANTARYSTPKRIRIYRILVSDPALAAKVIAECGGPDGLKRWSQFARESSLDKATYLRDGDLGFVHSDGNTDAPTVRVDPALFAAADTIADGAIAKDPLREGDRWAVVWRRGSLPALERSLADEQPAIVELLTRQRVTEARSQLLASLRAKYVTAFNDAPLDMVELSFPPTPARERPALVPHAAAGGSATPAPGERGQR